MRNEPKELWLALAMSAPLAHFCGLNWRLLLPVGLLCGMAAKIAREKIGQAKPGRIYAWIQIVFLTFVLSQLAKYPAEYWPGKGNQIVIPGVLLAISAWGCCKNCERTTAVLYRGMVILMIPVLIAGLKSIRAEWILSSTEKWDAEMVTVLLLPCVAANGFPKEGKQKRYDWKVLLGGLAVWFIAQGVLSPGVAAAESTPFRELSRGLELGAMSRFESVVSVAITLGWFGLFSLLLNGICSFAELLGLKRGIAAWLGAISAFGIHVINWEFSGVWLALGSVIIWVLLPVLYFEKFLQKNKKTA